MIISMGFKKRNKYSFKKGYVPWNKGKKGTYSANKGSNHPKWKGGRRKTSTGYIIVLFPEHPNSRKDGYVLEHRLVMSKKLGRPLKPEEWVHHINGNKVDNRQKNLQVVNKNEHTIWQRNLRLEVKCPRCQNLFKINHR